MRRRDFISIIGAAATTGMFAAPALAEQVRKIGVLMGMDAGDPVGQSEVRALKQGLHELGWIEGHNLQIERYWPGGQLDRIQASAKELVGLKCSLSRAPLQLCRHSLGKRAPFRSFSRMSSIP